MYVKEHKERCVELHEDDPWMIGRLLRFLYYGTYHYDHHYHHPYNKALEDQATLYEIMHGRTTHIEDGQDNAPDRLVVDMRMYELGDKYCIPDLKAYAMIHLSMCHGEPLTTLGELVDPDLFDQNPDLKRFVAISVAKVAKLKGKETIEWPQGIRKLLQDDSELCLMVIEELV